MRSPIICTLLFLAVCASSLAKPPGLLPDQYGDTNGMANYPQQPLLIIVASARKLRHVGRWEEVLRAEIPTLLSLRVADISEQPRPSEEQVATKLRKRVPEDVDILIDLNNQWATDYDLDTTEPCLLVFDSGHALVGQFRGRPKDPLIAEVVTTLRDYFPADPSSDAP